MPSAGNTAFPWPNILKMKRNIAAGVDNSCSRKIPPKKGRKKRSTICSLKPSDHR